MNTGSNPKEQKPEGSRWAVLGKTGAGHISVGEPGDHVTAGLLFVNAMFDEALANAALASAAPALQAACRKALDDLANMTSEDFSKGADKSLREALQAALEESVTLPVLEKRERRRRARK